MLFVIDVSSSTPLHYGKLAVCKLLVSNGDTVKYFGTGYATPLHYAAEQGKVTACNWLLSKGLQCKCLHELEIQTFTQCCCKRKSSCL